MDKFWMVLGAGQPVFRHSSLTAAKAEAERLASENPASTFTVLESIAQVKLMRFQWEVHEQHPGNDVPF